MVANTWVARCFQEYVGFFGGYWREKNRKDGKGKLKIFWRVKKVK